MPVLLAALWVGLHAAAPAPLASALRVPGPLAPRIANYRIEVELDPVRHRLSGHEHLEWHNTQAEPARALWFHLYMNAFKNAHSAFMRELRHGEGRRPLDTASRFGSIDVRSLRRGTVELRASAHIARCPEDETERPDCPQDETVMDVPLSPPVAPGGQIDLDLDFEVQLPEVIARAGSSGDFHMAGQWFPKIAVFEPAPGGGARWNCHAYHADSEFYADFGEYRVSITTPARFVVGATGVLVEERETPGGRRTRVYHAEDVHDFAWVADPELHVARDRFEDVEITLLARTGSDAAHRRQFEPVKQALAELGRLFFPYPYRTLTLVEPPLTAIEAGGMEYPTLLAVEPVVLPRGVHLIEDATVHELVHQYFYGMLASNEFEEPWLDEGLTEYVTTYLQGRYFGDARSQLDLAGIETSSWDYIHRSFSRVADWDPPETPAWRFAPGRYWVVYGKTAAALRTLEAFLGHDRTLAALGQYARAMRFHHPHAQDFFDHLSRAVGEDLMWFLGPAFLGTEVLDYEIAELRSVPHATAGGTAPGAGSPAATESAAGPRFDSEVLLHRRGEFRFPVEVQVHFDDGQLERVRWDGRDLWHRLTFERPARALWAEIDPGRRVLLDTNWLNNGLRERPDRLPAGRMAVGVAFSLQTLLQVLGL
jgi:hypothetical protein